jgi:hypothetical protein
VVLRKEDKSSWKACCIRGKPAASIRRHTPGLAAPDPKARIIPVPAAHLTHRPPIMFASALRRQVARAPRLRPLRALSTTATRASTTANDYAGKGKYGSTYVMDTHTVEDLQGMSAQDVLKEHAGRPEKQMRHFTGASERVFVCIRMAAD